MAHAGDLEPTLSAFEQLVRAGEPAIYVACGILQKIDADYLIPWGHAALARDLHLQLKGKLNDKQFEASSLQGLGYAYRMLGETRKAILCHERELAIARELHNHEGERAALDNLGAALQEAERIPEAIEVLEQTLTMDQLAEDWKGAISSLFNLGQAYRQAGETGRAFRCHLRGRNLARELGDTRGEGKHTHDLGALYLLIGEVPKAIEHFRQALAIFREKHDRLAEGMCLWDLGSAYTQLEKSGTRWLREELVCILVALKILTEAQYPRKDSVLESLASWYRDIPTPDFEWFARSTATDGDTILKRATEQDYTFFQDSSPDYIDEVLELLGGAA